MGKSVIRIKKITIKNWKNVVNGSLLLENHRKIIKPAFLVCMDRMVRVKQH